MDVGSIAPLPDSQPLGSNNLTLKWNHSVVLESDFVSEWAAQNMAFDLAWTLGHQCLTANPQARSHQCEAKVLNQHHHKIRAPRFHAITEVVYDHESTGRTHHVLVLTCGQSLYPKPWAWTPHIKGFKCPTTCDFGNLVQSHEPSPHDLSSDAVSSSCRYNQQSMQPLLPQLQLRYEDAYCLPIPKACSHVQVCLAGVPNVMHGNQWTHPKWPHSFDPNAPEIQSDAHDVAPAEVIRRPTRTSSLLSTPLPANVQMQRHRLNHANIRSSSKVCEVIPAYVYSTHDRNSACNALTHVQACVDEPWSDILHITDTKPRTHDHCIDKHVSQMPGPSKPPRPLKARLSSWTRELPTLQCRLEHESPIAAFAARLPDDDNQGNQEQHDPQPNVPVHPAFVDDLSMRLARMGYNVWDPDFDVPVRTWYIDHATIRRWTAPRNLQLVGPPRGWEAQFSSLWVDQINPDEWFDVAVVYPDPPRTPRNSSIIMDLIVTQSLQLDRFPGLITVFPTRHEAFELFSVAASFEPHISGFDIAQAADAADMCRYQECTVTFGWQEIPFTLRPQHVMTHGDGFQLVVSHQPARLMLPSSSDSTAESSTARTAQPAQRDPQTQGQFPTTSPAQRFMTPLHIFQMEGQEVVLPLVNAQLAQPTNAMAQALHVPFNCIEALHIMPIAPDGFPELAIPAIVQRVGDIDLHSTDRLILIDTIYHHHPDTAGLLNRPTVVRAVQRVSCQVTRQQILFKAAVYHYCQFLQEGCAASLDGFLWPINHVDPRPVTHGSYATVDVPPPYGTQLETRMVADQLHENGTMDTMMNWLTEPDDMPDDTMQLIQVGAHTKVVTTMTNYHIRKVCQNYPLPDDIDEVHGSGTPSTHEPAHVDQPLSNQVQPKTQQTHIDFAPTRSPVVHNDSHNVHTRVVQSNSHLPQEKLANAVQLPKQDGQTKLHQFFTRRNCTAPRKQQQTKPGQTTLHQFFPSASHRPCSVSMTADAVPSHVVETPIAGEPHCPTEEITNSAIDHKCSASQERQPPVFTTSLPVQPAVPNPEPRPRPAWRIYLANIFDEMATVVHGETGPVMQVEVWYIHHRNFPECIAPRALELDNIQELWYADLCNLWFDRIQRQEPMRVVNVLPTPPHQARPRSAAHIILEQGFSPERIAVHFTAVFLGGTRLGLFQRVESSPTRICTRDMIVKHGFQLQCDFRPCNMHSVYIRFAMDEREEIFSGICVVLTVAPPHRSR